MSSQGLCSERAIFFVGSIRDRIVWRHHSVDLAERSVFQTPGDDMFDRVEDLVPGGAKGLHRLFP